MLKSRLNLLLLAQFATVSILPAVAANNNVTLGGHTVIVNRAGLNGQSVDDYTATIQGNLDNALVQAKTHSASALHVATVKGSPIITLAGYKIVTVDRTNAKLAKTTPTVLASRWAAAIRKELGNTSEVNDYIAQLQGDNSASSGNGGDSAQAAAPPTAPPMIQATTQVGAAYNSPPPAYNAPQPQMTVAAPLQARVVYAPAGMSIPLTLQTSLSTQAAQPGDLVQAIVSQDIELGNGRIAAGSTVSGTVTDAESGRRLDRSGSLSIKFTSLRTADGIETPIAGHLVGGIGKYADSNGGEGDTIHAETMKNKLESAALRGAVGAGTGAALGTAVGAVADGGHGAGRGAWSGAAIGAGAGVVDSLLVRKAADVVIKSGTAMQLQLDEPMSLTYPPQ
ncbi:MAG TPA: hypothetical protein V6D22_20180 [Candidatus Obscuribacterales bacterium]